uniref:Uncharacterized protein n=1 Tax=Plectus sambesii TaxID=2011161 RepID=A0A914WUR8_9BILA
MGHSDYSIVKTNSSASHRSSPDRDSGISDNASTVTVDKRELGSQAFQICHELTTIVRLSSDFLSDVIEGKESASELLDELQNKVHPFLITLDGEMSNIEQLLRKNLDRSRIGDSKVGWLLEYNRYQLEFRRVLMDLSGPVYEDLERVLRLRNRGCLGLSPKKETIASLREMSAGLERATKLIRNERAKPESAY